MQATRSPRKKRRAWRAGRPLNTLIVIAVALALLLLLARLGLTIEPSPFPAYPGTEMATTTVPLPPDLPAPVERFYRLLYGDSVPVVESAVISGRATMRFRGVTFPARFRFSHEAGRNYRHYIEATLFGVPILKVDESYLEGHSRLELPFGVSEGEAKVNQAANLGLWAEALWFPAIYLTDPRVRWEPVDEVTALLVVPFAEAEERFVVRFDPDSGLVRLLESMRYKEAASGARTLWLNEVLEWGSVDGHTVPLGASLTWFDEGSPWAILSSDEVAVNIEVEGYLRARGP